MNLKDMKIEPTSTFDQPSIVQKDDGWYWTDETYNEYGPCSSEESARARQSLYCALELGSDRVIHGKAHVLASAWRAKKAAESETVTHPCDQPAAYICMCMGACSCHWTEADHA